MKDAEVVEKVANISHTDFEAEMRWRDGQGLVEIVEMIQTRLAFGDIGATALERSKLKGVLERIERRRKES